MMRQRRRLALGGAGALLWGCGAAPPPVAADGSHGKLTPSRRAVAGQPPSRLGPSASASSATASTAPSDAHADERQRQAGEHALPDAGTIAGEIASTVRALASSDIEADGFGLSTVPEAARPLLSRLNGQLRDLGERALRDANGGAEQAEAAVAAALRAQAVLPPPASPRWGSVLGVHIEQPAHHPELRIVTTRWAVPCGEDSSLYVYRGARERWTRVLSRERENPERTAAGNALKYAIVEGRQGERWALASASTASSCTSLWRPLTLRIQREPRPGEAELLAEHSRPAYFPAGFGLSTFEGGVRLGWQGDLRFAPWYLRQGPESARYRLEEGGALQIPPLAGDPESVALDWLDLPTSDAPRWLCAEARPDAEQVLATHARVKNELPGMVMSPDFDHCDGKPQTPPCVEVTLALRAPNKARDTVKIRIQSQEQGQCVRSFTSLIEP